MELWHRWWLWIHLGLIFTGFFFLAAAGAAALMYLFQSAQLKSHHPNALSLRLPSLDSIDRLHLLALFWGILFFSLGILTGLLWANESHALANVFRLPKVSLSLVTCLAYWAVWAVRVSALRRGQKIAYSTLLLGGLLVLTFVSAYAVPAKTVAGV